MDEIYFRAACMVVLTLSAYGCAQRVPSTKIKTLSVSVAKKANAAMPSERLVVSYPPLDVPELPMVELSKALEKEPNRNLFRLNWSSSVMSWSESGTALYNRKNKTIKASIETSDAPNVYVRTPSYTKITDAMIHKIARAGAGGPGPFSLDVLIEYGAIRVKE